jgi:alginate O-acetyltransferase complex protein AlgI
MVETLLNPLHFAILVICCLVVGISWKGSWELLRPVAFLVLNVFLLAWWFGGKWQGVINLLVISTIFFILIQYSKGRYNLWVLTLCSLVLLLALAKYDYPPWLPHYFRGGIILRTIKYYLGVPPLKETIGVSYLCFRFIHVLVDYSNGNLSKINFITFLNYAFFAPTSIAGPINRFENFSENFSKPSPLTSQDFLTAIGRIIIGLAKKILIAGLISPYALGSLEPNGKYASLLLIVACICYSIYIYADFSGYTDIAIGLGTLFGIKLPENFNRPFSALTIQDFWNRWHISLTAWIKTYVFFPLNLWLTRKNPQGAKNTNPILAILAAFALIGIWHGPTWNFLVFGIFHGLGISLNMLLRSSVKSSKAVTFWDTTWRQVLTFGFVSFSWIFFVYPLGDIPWLMRQLF